MTALFDLRAAHCLQWLTCGLCRESFSLFVVPAPDGMGRSYTAIIGLVPTLLGCLPASRQEVRYAVAVSRSPIMAQSCPLSQVERQLYVSLTTSSVQVSNTRISSRRQVWVSQ